eukprot:980420-Amorphochlora_amoeboformis.AAC.2
MEFCRHSLIFRPGYKAARRLVVYFFVSVWVLGSISHLCCALSEYKTAHASRPACIRRSIANPRVLARTPPRRLLPLRGGARGGPGRRAGSKGGSTKRKRGRHATDGHKVKWSMPVSLSVRSPFRHVFVNHVNSDLEASLLGFWGSSTWERKGCGRRAGRLSEQAEEEEKSSQISCETVGIRIL